MFSVHAEQAVLAAALKARGYHCLLELLHPDAPIKPRHRRALLRARRMFRGLSIAIERQTATEGWANAMPCARCKQMLLRFGIQKVEYTTPDGWVVGKVRDCSSTETTAYHNCAHVLLT